MAIEPLCTAALQLPPLEAGALVLVDMDAPQFLTDGGLLTGLVDTEAYVIGLRELGLHCSGVPDESARRGCCGTWVGASLAAP